MTTPVTFPDWQGRPLDDVLTVCRELLEDDTDRKSVV